MVTQEFELSVTPLGDMPVIHLNKDDADFQLVFYINSRSGTFTMENNTSAQIRGTKPDGTKFQASGTVSVANKKVTINGDKNMTNVPCIGIFEICLTHARKELYTQNFKVCIEDI